MFKNNIRNYDYFHSLVLYHRYIKLFIRTGRLYQTHLQVPFFAMNSSFMQLLLLPQVSTLRIIIAKIKRRQSTVLFRYIFSIRVTETVWSIINQSSEKLNVARRKCKQRKLKGSKITYIMATIGTDCQGNVTLQNHACMMSTTPSQISSHIWCGPNIGKANSVQQVWLCSKTES